MAIYHLSVKAISRSDGRSATAAAAYRAAAVITDERTGETHDYSRKRGVEVAELVLPAGAPSWDRARLWNAAELAEKRKDACVAREYEVALPAELNAEQRRELACSFARELAEREGCAVDVAIHAPDRAGDQRNYHAHIMRTTRQLGADGLGAKLATEQAGRKRTDDLAAIRERWAELANAALERAGTAARIDHRSHAERGIEAEPTRHLGPAAVGYERRTGEPSRRRLALDEVSARLAAAQQAGQEERALEQSIIALSGDIRAAQADRERAVAQERSQQILDEPTERERLAQERIEQRRLVMAEVLAEALASQASPRPPRPPTQQQASQQARTEPGQAPQAPRSGLAAPPQASHQEQPPQRIDPLAAMDAYKKRQRLIEERARIIVAKIEATASQAHSDLERAIENLGERPGRLGGLFGKSAKEWDRERAALKKQCEQARKAWLDVVNDIHHSRGGSVHKARAEEQARTEVDAADPELAEQAAIGAEIIARRETWEQQQAEKRQLTPAKTRTQTKGRSRGR